MANTKPSPPANSQFAFIRCSYHPPGRCPRCLRPSTVLSEMEQLALLRCKAFALVYQRDHRLVSGHGWTGRQPNPAGLCRCRLGRESRLEISTSLQASSDATRHAMCLKKLLADLDLILNNGAILLTKNCNNFDKLKHSDITADILTKLLSTVLYQSDQEYTTRRFTASSDLAVSPNPSQS